MTSEPGSKPPAGEKPRSKARRILIRAVAAIVGGLLLLVSAWMFANVVFRDATPKPLWTEAELPTLPPEAQNGWRHLATTVRSPRSVDQDLIEITLPKKPRPDDVVWREAETEAVRVKTAADDIRAMGDYADFLKALESPRFVDACPIDFTVSCPHLSLFRMHQWAELDALSRGLEKQWPEAFQLSTRLVRADFDYLSSARSLIAHAIGMAMAQRTLELASLLTHAHKTQGSPAHSELKELCKALSEVGAGPIHSQRAVISEYLAFTQAIKMVGQEEALRGTQAAGFEGVFARILFDPGATMNQNGAHYRALMAYAKDPTGAPPAPPKERTKGFGWWLHNPMGKIVLDTMSLDPAPRIKRFEEDKKKLLAKRDELLLRCKAPDPEEPTVPDGS